MSTLDNHSTQRASPPTGVDSGALLGALALFLAALEFLFPKPLPYIRLGLANIPLLIALRIFSVRQFFTLVLLKVFGQAVLHGTLGSYVFLFSLGGSCASALAMVALDRALRNAVTLVGISTVSALVSNVVQLVLSIAFVFGKQAVSIAPLFLGIGVVGGVTVGFLAEFFWQHSRFVAELRTSRR